MPLRKGAKQDDRLRFFILLEDDVPVEICDALVYASRDNEIACETMGAIQVRTYFSGVTSDSSASIAFVTHLLEPDGYGSDENGKPWFRPIVESPTWRSWPRAQAIARHARVVEAVRNGEDLTTVIPSGAA